MERISFHRKPNNYYNMKQPLLCTILVSAFSLANVIPMQAEDAAAAATTDVAAPATADAAAPATADAVAPATADAAAPATAAATITKAEVNAAQQAWCDALILIGKTHEEGGDAKAVALKVLTDAYDYDQGSVFFRPTLAHGKNSFRPTKEGALSYFVGGDPNFPEDEGFALKPWVGARYDNMGDGDEGIQIHGNIAITMGNVWVTAKDGTEVMVDKTFVFKKAEDGKLRLIVHKSVLPYTPEK